MTKWVIVLVIYYAGRSGRVDILPLENILFNGAMKCNEYRLSKEFQNKLREKYKDMNVAYVKPVCKLVNYIDERIAFPRNSYIPDDDWPIEYLFNPTGPIDFTGEMKFEDES